MNNRRIKKESKRDVKQKESIFSAFSSDGLVSSVPSRVNLTFFRAERANNANSVRLHEVELRE